MARVLNLQFTDSTIIFTEHNTGKSHVVLNAGKLNLNENIISNGKIIDVNKTTMYLKYFFKKNRVRASNVNLVVPSEQVTIRRVEVPASVSEKDIPDYLKTQLTKNIYLPFKNPYYVYQILNKTVDEYEIVMYVTNNEELIEYVKILKSLRKKVVRLDLASLNMVTMLEKELSNQNIVSANEHRLIAYNEADKLFMSIYQNNIPYYSIAVDLEVEADDTKDIQKYNEQKAEKVISEIERISNFFKYSLNQGRIQVGIIGISVDKNINDYVRSKITQTLEIEAVCFDFRDFKIKKNQTSLQAEHATVLGSSIISKNPQNIKLAVPKLESNWPFIVRLVLIILVGSLMFVVQYLYNDILNSDKEQKEREVYNVAREVAEMEDKFENSEEVNDLIEYYNIVRELESTKININKYIDDLTSYLLENMSFYNYNYSVNQSISFTIKADNDDDIVLYAKSLEELGWIYTVDYSSITYLIEENEETGEVIEYTESYFEIIFPSAIEIGGDSNE